MKFPRIKQSMQSVLFSWTIGLPVVIVCSLLTAMPAHAVPSFARQTGLACASCHTVFPELTPFGRSFKLHGYTLTGTKQISAESSRSDSALKLNSVPPISAMLQVSFTNVKNSPSGSQNDDVQFPQEFSLFYAGAISENAGSFVQVTYEQASGNFGWDNTDIRYANDLPDANLTYGLTLNNSPMVQDLWNTGPVWSFPWSGPGDAAPAGPSVEPFIGSEDFVALASGGLGAYAMWNDSLYGELTLYRSAHVGTAAPDGGSNQTIANVAPYWRLAWQHTADNGDNLMFGTYGMLAKFHPNGVDGNTDRYIDTALDTQYEHPFGNGDMLSVHASYTHEDQDIHSTGMADALEFDSVKVDGTYHLGSHATATLGYFNTWGDNGAYYPGYVNGDGDPLNPTASGTDSFDPDSSAWTAQASYLPWENTKLSLQYTAFTKLDGSSKGSDTTDNNTLYLLAWFVF
jgi:hypothetical protein